MTNGVWFHLYKNSQIHRLESTLLDAQGWGVEEVRRGNGKLVFNGDRVSVYEVENLGDGWLWELYNSVNTLSATELYS